jgi:putative nucleotidyltransferase with HDIG domain
VLKWIRALGNRLARGRAASTTEKASSRTAIPSLASARRPPRPPAPPEGKSTEAEATGAATTAISAGEGEARAGFASFAQALGIEPPADPLPLSPEEEREDARLATLILERFAKARPEPASFPAIALRILNLVASPEAEVVELATLVSRDPALSAGVLSVANSVVFRGLMEVETVREAAVRLGLAEVGKIAAAVSARTLFSPRLRAEQTAFGERWQVLFRHSVAVGSAAAAFAQRHPGARADRVYLGGLLHDVGKSLALRILAGAFVERRIAAPEAARLERVLDRVHVELGGEAHQAWALPQYLTVICVRHHDDAVPGDPELVDLHFVRLTSAVADLGEPAFAARAGREIAQSAAALRLDPYEVRALAAEVRQAHERTRAFGK